MNTDVSIVFLTYIAYNSAIAELYRAEPGLAGRSFAEQRRRYVDSWIGYSDGFSHAMTRIGRRCHQIFFNLWSIQAAWAREHGLALSRAPADRSRDLLKIALAQIKAEGPDAVYIQGIEAYPAGLGTQIRAHCPSVRLVIAASGFETKPAHLGGVDALTVATPSLRPRFVGPELPVRVLYHGVDPRRVAGRLDHGRSIPAVFTGSSGVGWPSHGERYWTLMRLMIDAPLRCWLYEVADDPPAEVVEAFSHAVAEAGRRPEAAAGLLAKLRQSDPTPRVPLARLFGDRCAPPVFGRALFALLAQAGIVVNSHVDVARGDVGNLRLFEATAAGACLLTDHGANLPALFDPETEVVGYRGPEDCLARLRWLLDDEPARRRIAEAGWRRTARDHTLERRCAEIAELVETLLRRPAARWFAEGEAARGTGEPALAERRYRHAVAFDPGQGRAWHRLGNVLKAQDQLAAAEGAYRCAWRCDGDNPELLRQLGNVLRQRLRCDEALAVYDRALACAPDDTTLGPQIAFALLAKGRGWTPTDDATLAARAQALADAGGAPAVRVDLADVLFWRGAADQALDHYRRAIADTPAEPVHRYTIGHRLALLGEAGAACAAWREAAAVAAETRWTPPAAAFRTPAALPPAELAAGDGILLTAGYPKSGNVWLSNLLAACLDLPPGRVAMTHDPLHGGVIGNPYIVRAVVVVRDLRDVIVSLFHNWPARRARLRRGVPFAYETADQMYQSFFLQHHLRQIDLHPHLEALPEGYVDHGVPVVRYEDLNRQPVDSLLALFGHWRIAVNRERIVREVERFSLANLRTGRTTLSQAPPVGPHHFRRGVAGGFRDELTPATIADIERRFADYLARWGYVGT